MTGWLVYPTRVIQLAPGERTGRSFTVAVPVDAGAGEYITSLVLENDQSIRDAGAIGLDQILRQAVAVVVTVPGRRSPGLSIGLANHVIVAGTSVVQVAVDNTGNVRLKPIVGFTLFAPTGAEISRTTVQMDTFYARTSTFIEVLLATLLPPGTYSVRLSLHDTGQRTHADRTGIALIVEAPAETVAPVGVVPGLIDVFLGPDGGSTAILGLLIAASFVFGIWLAWLALRRRRRSVV
jgi:hypothetical protein